MIPENSRVKILLRNNTIAEGIVQEWGEIVKLQSFNKQSYMIVLHPKEDIILVKVFSEDATEEVDVVLEKQPLENVKNELEQKFQQVVDQPSDDPTRMESLVELRKLLVQQDRQILANKLKSHHIGQTRKVEYGSPRFFAKPRSQ